MINKHKVTRLLLTLWFVQTSFTSRVWSAQFPVEGYECSPWGNKTVTVKDGVMTGFTTASYKGRFICSFTRIPYSQPPVGDLRFKEPQPLKPWKGVLDATKHSPQCVHCLLFSPAIAGQEDCLYLNVYSPKLSAGSNGELLDVVVFIFPGEFYYRSTSSKEFDAVYFADKDVVLVTLSYRLGAFGYLSTGDDEAPGNYGLKDQVAALRWVQENIHSFGGNVSSVTLIGHSAGSSSVEYHLLSPLSKGLFHKAISMEGSVLNPWARYPDPLKQAQKQASAVHCPTEPTDKLVACLRSMDTLTLQYSMIMEFPWLVLPSPGYAPVVETKTERNPEPFITEDPLKMIKDGKFQNIPWLLGGNNEPAGIFAVPILQIEKVLDLVNSHTGDFYEANLMMWISAPKEDVKPLTKQVVKHYLGSNLKCTFSNYMQFIDMLGDRLMTHGVHKSAELHAKAGHAPIYKYHFSYRPMFSGTMVTAPLMNYGTSHGDELQFFFKGKNTKTPELPEHPDYKIRELLLDLWTNFAKYGNPTPDDVTNQQTGLIKGLKWEPIIDPECQAYLHIGQEGNVELPAPMYHLAKTAPKVFMDKHLYADRMSFWDSLPLSENANI